MTTGKYVINLSGSRPDVSLDDKSIAVKEVYLQQRQDEFPVLTLVLDPGSVEATGESEYDIISPQYAISEFIKKIDVQKFEEAVMAKTPFSDNVFQNMKEVLSEWADA